jgi:hypothetical protein
LISVVALQPKTIHRSSFIVCRLAKGQALVQQCCGLRNIALKPGQPDVVNLLLDGIQGLKLFREWLEQQTVTGVLTVENPQAEATARRFRLSPAHAEVLTERDSLNYLAPLAQLVVGATSPIKSVLEVFQNPRQKANHKGTKRRSNYSARD